jgi:hypothetical protein
MKELVKSLVFYQTTKGELSLKQVLKYLVRVSFATVGELIVVGSVIGFVTVFATAIGHSVLPFNCILYQWAR